MTERTVIRSIRWAPRRVLRQRSGLLLSGVSTQRSLWKYAVRGRQRLQRRDDDGSVTAFVAVLLVALFALMGLVVDGGTAISAQQSAVDEAEQAARAGA